MKQLIRLCGFISVCSSLLLNCSYNVNKSKSDQEDRIQQKTISGYEAVSKFVIGPNCLNCHSNASGNRGGLNLENYDSIKLQLNQIYLRSVERQDMPPGGLEPALRDILKDWIENGAAKQSSLGAGDLKGPLTWKDIKSKILQTKCLDCHSLPNPEGNIDLSNYETFKSNINSIFDHVFIKQDMPLAPYPSLSLGEKTALLKWISQGFPQ